MLSPVAAVSSTSSTSPQREGAVVAEMLTGMSAAPDTTIALSMAVSAGVEGKLNILLLNARARMLDSLFAVIDAVSKALALPQAPGESKADYALRLANAMTALPPKQMAVLQQQLAAKGQTAPLSLLAAALHDPAGAEAAKLITYLEVVRYKDRDFATKSVVASYGQNNSQAENNAAALPAPARNVSAQPPATSPNVLPQPGQSAVPTPPTAATVSASVPPQEVRTAVALPPPSSAASPAATDPHLPRDPHATPAAIQPAVAAANPGSGQTSASIPASTAAEAARPSTVPGAPDEAIPRANLQIRSDIKEGLKAVFDRLVQATGTELLQTLAEAAPLADKAIAQALIADMIDTTALNGLVQDSAKSPERATILANATPAPLTPQTMADEAVPVIALNPALSDGPEPPPTVTAQQPPVIPPGLAVGFVTTPYAPAEDAVKDKDAKRIDRVDAIDDDEHEGQGEQAQGEAEDDHETPAEEALDLLEAEPDAATPIGEPQTSRSSLTALPRKTSAEPAPNAGYDLYQRMGA